MNNNKFDTMIFAPLPPPVGGIASIAKMLREGLSEYDNVVFKQPIGKNKSALNRSILNLIMIIRSTLSLRKNATVLLFSSSGFSFYEKVFWSMLIVLLKRRVVLVMVDGNFPRFYNGKSKLFKIVTQKFLSNEQVTLGVQSGTWLRYYKEIFPKSNLCIVSASTDDAFQNTEKKYLPNGDREIVLLYVGWIIEEKGILDLLNAIAIVSKITTAFKMELVGPAFGKENFWNEKVKAMALDKLVIFTKPIMDRGLLIEKLKGSDVFIFPSHYEGLPVAVIEAISIGLPCIATNVGAISDLLDNGRVGKLIEPNNPKQLAACIIELINDDGLRKHLGEHAAKWAKQNYDFNSFISSYKNVLQIK